jgi:hypothetical protein
MSDEYLSTADAAAILECSASNLAQFSHRLRRVCVRTYVDPARHKRKCAGLAWPRRVIETAQELRVSHPTIGVARAIEAVTGMPDRPIIMERFPELRQHG